MKCEIEDFARKFLVLFFVMTGLYFFFYSASKVEEKTKERDERMIRIEQKIDKLTQELGYTKGEL